MRCPSCKGRRIWKGGLRYGKGGHPIQRYLCPSCGFRFSEGEPQNTNGSYCHSGNRLVCVSLAEGTKNLVEQKTQKLLQHGYTGDTADPTEIQLIANQFRKWLAEDGKTQTTIDSYVKYIQNLIRKKADIFDPQSVKATIARQTWDRNTKVQVVNIYTTFLRFIGKTWDKPKYKPIHRQTLIPTNKERELAINCGYKESVIFFRFLDETGCRLNEAERAEWTDLDIERSRVTIKASKNGNPRILCISRDLINSLSSLPRKGSFIFSPKAPNTRRALFHRRMKQLARIHNNPRFLKIHPHTFRHCKALRELHKTNNAMRVKRVMGHRSLLTTQRYVELYTEVYGDLQPDGYVCETASTIDEAKKLIEADYEYVSELEGVQLYRKVKETV